MEKSNRKDKRRSSDQTTNLINNKEGSEAVLSNSHYPGHKRESNVSLVFAAEKLASNLFGQPKGSLTTLQSLHRTHINCRTVLWYLAFIGFAVNYMLRINMNIAIVAMILPRKSLNNVDKIIVYECYNHTVFLPEVFTNTSSISVLRNATNRFSIEKSLLNFLQIDYNEDGFDWNERQQGLLLGSFFWLHWATQIPGGILARKYGTKIVFGLSNFIGCLLCGLMPIVAYLDIQLLIILRVIQGTILGLAWPAMHNLTAQWIPPNERSKFVTAYLGSSVGIAIFFPLFGYVISWSSWEWIFHLCVVIGTLWYIGWYNFVYDSPAQHPRIDAAECEYIENSLGETIQHEKLPTPWKKILTSRPVWMNVIAQWGGIWGLFTLMTQAPTYFKLIHGWNIKMTGILSGFPHLTRIVFAYVFSTYGDYLLRTNKMSRTNVRKLAGTMCCIVNGLFVLCLAYSGCNSLAAIVFLTLATAVHGAVSTGPLVSLIDISPNFSGVILGISGMIGVAPGFISPYIVGQLTLNNQTIQQWRYVFLIAASMLIGTGILYVLFAQSKVQSWNNVPHKCHVEEFETIRPKFNSKKESFDEHEEDEENEYRCMRS